jgi:hypothetical protein
VETVALLTWFEWTTSQEPGWMYHLSTDSNDKKGMFFTANVFVIHAWWAIATLKKANIMDPESQSLCSVFFTTYQCIMIAMANDMEELINVLKHMDMIIQCCYSHCVPTPGKPEKWLDFLTMHMLRNQVVVYPPLSVLVGNR